jgi:hypothetical protein
MVASRRRSGSTGVRKKATFLLSNDLLQHLNAAISAGVAPSKNAFVEEALVRALLEVRRRDRKARLEAASHDPLFVQDVDSVVHDFRFADAETARGMI